MDSPAILPKTVSPEAALREALRALERGHAVAVATVIARHGSAPSTPGQKLALAWDGPRGAPHCAVGTVGGGAVEQAVVRAMIAAIGDVAAQPKVHTFRLGPTLGMCCGGSAEILVEVWRPGLALLLVGAGHVGLATARLAAELGFSVLLVDARDGATDPSRTEEARAKGARVLPAEHDDPEVLEQLGAAPAACALVVMTHDHALDQRVIEWGLDKGFAFVGGVGSRAKAERTRQRLQAKGAREEDLARVRMPVGVAIGARRPLEIAVAIAGELIEVRSRMERTARTPLPEPASDRAAVKVVSEHAGEA